MPWIKPTSYEVNHNLTNIDLKQKSIWISNKKAKVQDCVFYWGEITTILWSIATDLMKLNVEKCQIIDFKDVDL